MKNWRTTLAGIALSAYPIVDSVMQAYAAGYFTDKTGMQLWLGVGFIVFGVLAKDHNVSGKPNNTTSDDGDDIGGGGIKNPPPTGS